MICDRCNQDKEDVVETADPFIRDVYNEIVNRNLCDDCYEERRDEI
jgi:hypothetical protein